MANPLEFDHVPDLPQKSRLVSVASRLWESDTILAVWLAGSFAQGTSDLSHTATSTCGLPWRIWTGGEIRISTPFSTAI